MMFKLHPALPPHTCCWGLKTLRWRNNNQQEQTGRSEAGKRWDDVTQFVLVLLLRRVNEIWNKLDFVTTAYFFLKWTKRFLHAAHTNISVDFDLLDKWTGLKAEGLSTNKMHSWDNLSNSDRMCICEINDLFCIWYWNPLKLEELLSRLVTLLCNISFFFLGTSRCQMYRRCQRPNEKYFRGR